MEGGCFGGSVLTNSRSHQDVVVTCTSSSAWWKRFTFNASDLFLALVAGIDSRLNHLTSRGSHD